MAIRAQVGFLLASIALGGCGAVGTAPSNGPSTMTLPSSAAPTALVTSPSPTIDVPLAIGSPSPADLDAIRFRTSVGLRADLGYVRYVAGNPLASSMEFAVPLMPDELAEMNARSANAETVVPRVQAYAALHQDEFGGIYLDQEEGSGAVTTLWTGHVDQHEAAIRALAGPNARVGFRSATFTYSDLRALQDRISANWDWMRSLEIAPTGVGVDVIGNAVRVEISSADPAAPAIVAAHYPVAAGMLEVTSDGTGAVLIPRGTVKGRVVDSLGKLPGDLLAGQLILQWTSDGPGDCGGGDIGFGLAGDGSFELPCQAGGHTIMVQIGVPNSDWKTLGSGHVMAVGNATVSLLIKLKEPWPAPNPG